MSDSGACEQLLSLLDAATVDSTEAEAATQMDLAAAQALLDAHALDGSIAEPCYFVAIILTTVLRYFADNLVV